MCLESDMPLWQVVAVPRWTSSFSTCMKTPCIPHFASTFVFSTKSIALRDRHAKSRRSLDAQASPCPDFLLPIILRMPKYFVLVLSFDRVSPAIRITDSLHGHSLKNSRREGKRIQPEMPRSLRASRLLPNRRMHPLRARKREQRKL